MTERALGDLERQIGDLERRARETGDDVQGALRPLLDELAVLKNAAPVLSRWERVQLARAPGRPSALDYVERVFSGFVELHGDRVYGDDPALLGGPARLGGTPVMLLFQQKGRDTKAKIKRRFGMSNPEGYRKAVRLMDLADKFGLPVVTLIDTPGAYPGIEAEERGQGWAIAECIQRMVRLKVPVVCTVIGEGGSGGALALGVGNRVLIQENAWYSVISPEGCATILWRDASEAPRAAEAMQLTAPDLQRLGIVEEVVPEPQGGAHLDPEAAARLLGAAIERNVRDLLALGPDQLRAARAARFRDLGVFAEA